MAVTHGSGVLLASTSNLASGTTTSTGTWDNTGGLGGIITAKITNGATAPTIACTATVNVSRDNSTWQFAASQTAGTAANTAYPMIFELPAGFSYAQVVFSGNTAQTVVIEAQYQSLTSAA